MEKPVYSSPPPACSNPENNTCKLIEYRGARVAAFKVDGRELICLPQAFELFLKHLVGGLHTVYTKLKRLDITPVVCNVEQVRILRGLGAIQPGVNRCKLIAPKEFDTLYDDCTNSSARPGRPPKRSALVTPDTLEKLKKSRMENGDCFNPNRMMDFKKSPLFTNGYHYPPHLAHMPFMPLGHPAIMNFAMANHLGMRPDHLQSQLERQAPHGTDLSAHGPRMNEDKDENPRGEYNNNNRDKTHDMDKPLNLTGLHHRVERRPSITDKESVSSASDAMTNGQPDYSKSGMHSGNEDLDADADDESEEDREFDDEIHEQRHRLPTTSVPSSMQSGRPPAQSLASLAPQILNSEAPGISSVETLLMNIQGLLKVAAGNARHREQQIHLEKAEMKMEILKEREMRETIEKQLMEEQKNRSILQKRLKKEKKARRRFQDQLETIDHVGPREIQHSLGQSVIEDHLRQAQDNLRMLNESVNQDSDNERDHSDGERKMSEPPRSGIQNLMETYLSSAPKVSTCASSNGYLHSPVIKQTEAV